MLSEMKDESDLNFNCRVYRRRQKVEADASEVEREKLDIKSWLAKATSSLPPVSSGFPGGSHLQLLSFSVFTFS